jgi:hypothetical protein
MVSRSVAAVAALVAVVGLPGAAAQLENPSSSTPTTLYFHIFDTFNAFPINTQPMDVGFFGVSGTNFPTVAAQGYDFNTIYGFSTSGPVEYDFIENGRPRFHPERGIAADVLIDEAVQPVAYLYVDVRDLVGADTQGAGLPQVLPSLTFRITVRSGNEVAQDEVLDAGELLMSGQRTAHVADTHSLGANGALPPSGPDGAPVLVADEDGVVEFAVPLTVAKPAIPKSDSFNVRIDWYQDPVGGQEDEVAEGWMRLVLDQKHLPRLEMAVLNPVYIEFIHPQVAAGTLLIHSGVNSPWGTYDVDVGNMTLSIEGPAQPRELARVVTQNAHVHGLHDQAAEVTWLWDFRAEDAPSGDYTLRLAVPNLAGTAAASGAATFTIEGTRAYGFDEAGNEVAPAAAPDGKQSPAPPVPALLLGLAALALASAARRRA